MYLIDTNILISELLFKYEQDPLTLKYHLVYQRFPLIERVVTDFVLNEFELYMMQVAPVRYKFPENIKKELSTVTCSYMKKIINTFTLFSPSLNIMKNAYLLYERFHQIRHISFTDSLLLSSAKTNAFAIFTKDKRLNRTAQELNIPFYQ